MNQFSAACFTRCRSVSTARESLPPLCPVTLTITGVGISSVSARRAREDSPRQSKAANGFLNECLRRFTTGEAANEQKIKAGACIAVKDRDGIMLKQTGATVT
jgi:hypothetical protein